MESLKSILKWKQISKGKHLRKDQLLIFLLVGVLLIVIAIPTEPKKKSSVENMGAQEENGNSSVDFTGGGGTYEEQQEQRLREALSKVEGVGRVEVMITLSSSGERVVEKDQPTNSQTVEEKDSQGGSRTTHEESWSEETIYQEEEDGSRTPYVVKELEPKVEGVMVIAEGGGNSVVKQEILEAVEALFSVDAHKIKIMKMEGSK